MRGFNCDGNYYWWVEFLVLLMLISMPTVVCAHTWHNCLPKRKVRRHLIMEEKTIKKKKKNGNYKKDNHFKKLQLKHYLLDIKVEYKPICQHNLLIIHINLRHSRHDGRVVPFIEILTTKVCLLTIAIFLFFICSTSTIILSFLILMVGFVFLLPIRFESCVSQDQWSSSPKGCWKLNVDASWCSENFFVKLMRVILDS